MAGKNARNSRMASALEGAILEAFCAKHENTIIRRRADLRFVPYSRCEEHRKQRVHESIDGR